MGDNFIYVNGLIPKWKERGNVYNSNFVSPTILATDYKTPKLIEVNNG